MKQMVLNSWQENWILSMMTQMQIMAKVLKFNLCDYNVAYILVRGDITVTAASVT